MDPNNITFGLALLAGLASFLSPCVLSLVPAYIGYLGGRAVSANSQQTELNRWITFSHGIAFVLGFSFVFIFIIGLPAGLLALFFGNASFELGGVVYNAQKILAQVGGLVVIVFGLHTIGIITLPFLEYDTRTQVAPRAEIGYVSSVMMGIFFAAGWSPCVGPVLSAVLTLGLAAESVGRAAFLLVAYSAGLAIPFLISALAIGQVTQLIRKYSRYTRYVSIATGVVMVVIGVLLFTGTYQSMAGWLAGFGTFFNFGI